MHFAYAAQHTKEESLVEWADRVVSLAFKAFPGLTDDALVYRQAIMRFCQGCLDKRAGHYAINQRPSTMEDALDKVRWFQHTEKLMNERPRRDIRSMTLSDSEEDDDEEYGGPQYSVSRAFTGSGGSEQQTSNKKVHFQRDAQSSTRLDKLESKVNKMDDKIDNIMSSMESLKDAVKKISTRSPSPRPRSRSPLRCFGCGKEGHFKNMCPENKITKICCFSI